MGLTVNVRGMDELLRRLEEALDGMERGAKRAVADEVRDMADDMREGAPVGSAQAGTRGDPPLSDSVVEHVDGLTGRAGPTAPHTPHVEHGTKSHPAQPFVGPAAERARRRFPERVADEIRKELT